MIRAVHFILYVADQARSRDFYAAVLGCAPKLDVPGMTEFSLGDAAILGLMPQTGIVRLLGPTVEPARGGGPGRAEVYLIVDDAGAFHARALAAGAGEISPLMDRDWGHRAAYSLDPDGYVFAVASPL